MIELAAGNLFDFYPMVVFEPMMPLTKGEDVKSDILTVTYQLPFK